MSLSQLTVDRIQLWLRQLLEWERVDLLFILLYNDIIHIIYMSYLWWQKFLIIIIIFSVLVPCSLLLSWKSGLLSECFLFFRVIYCQHQASLQEKPFCFGSVVHPLGVASVRLTRFLLLEGYISCKKEKCSEKV